MNSLLIGDILFWLCHVQGHDGTLNLTRKENTMEIKVNTLAHSMQGLIFALLDNSIVFDKPQLTRQDLIDMMQARSPWKGGYDNEWIGKVVDQAINDWESI